nr:DUF2079 domain-containing protein [Streptomyces acidipaludis]
MQTMSWDLGIFEQAVKSYAHLHAPVADLKGPGFDVLGDHFSPVTALIAPFYRVFPTPLTLLVAQALLFALAVVPVTRVAQRFLGRGRGLAVGAAYGLSWGVQRAVDFDFHEVAFAVPLLAFSLESVLRGRWAAALWWAVPLVLVKEDLGATAAMIGLLVRIRTRHERRARRGGTAGTYALALVAFGIAASAWEIRWLIPAFHGPGYDAFAHINGEGALTGHIPAATAVRTLLWVLLPAGGLLALRSPLLLVTLPTLGWRFVSHYPENWGTAWHYSAVLMPVVFLALVDAIAALERRGPHPVSGTREGVLHEGVPREGGSAAGGSRVEDAPGEDGPGRDATAAGARDDGNGDGDGDGDAHEHGVPAPRPSPSPGPRLPRGPLRGYAAAMPAAAAGAALALSVQLPLAGLTHAAAYRVDARTRAVERLLDRIPDGATVESDVGPLSRLVHRTTVYWIGGSGDVVPRYIALGDATDWLDDPVRHARALHPGSRWTLVARADNCLILRRV